MNPIGIWKWEPIAGVWRWVRNSAVDAVEHWLEHYRTIDRRGIYEPSARRPRKEPQPA
jgi:hypothetical protein